MPEISFDQGVATVVLFTLLAGIAYVGRTFIKLYLAEDGIIQTESKARADFMQRMADTSEKMTASIEATKIGLDTYNCNVNQNIECIRRAGLRACQVAKDACTNLNICSSEVENGIDRVQEELNNVHSCKTEEH